MKKKLVSLLLVLAMAATGLAGCAGNSAGTGDSAEQSGEAQGESQTVSTPPPPQIPRRILPHCAAIKRRMRKRSTK